MRRYISPLSRFGLAGLVLAITLLGGSAAFALPPQANAHAEAASSSGGASGSAGVASGASAGSANGQIRLQAAQLRSCQNREKAINNIMGRIDTRAQNQLTLFGTIATRVETFYTAKSKTVSNYDQLVAAIATAKTQATTDLSTLQTNGTFSCTENDPKGAVGAFQGYLKTETSDLQNYRTAVKNLIVAVASANGVTVPGSSGQSDSQGGQQ